MNLGKTFLCIAAVSLLCSCGNDKDGEQTDTAIIESVTSESFKTESETVLSEPSEAVTEETQQTVSYDELEQLALSVERPEIIISADSSREEILLAGKTAGEFYGGHCSAFFGFGIEYGWHMADELRMEIDGISADRFFSDMTFRRAESYYTDRGNKIYAPTDYSHAKQFVSNFIGLTERGFYELCSNSPSRYLGIDGELYLCSADGGDAGLSYSEVTDYELSEDTVTFFYQRVGLAEEWGYDENVVMPFTFRLAYEDEIWKLDGCSYGEGLFEMGITNPAC